MTTTEATRSPALIAGQQFLGLINTYREADELADYMQGRKPEDGLTRAVTRLGLTTESLIRLDKAQLAEIGREGLDAFFDAQNQGAIRDQAISDKYDAEATIRDKVKELAGSTVTARLLDDSASFLTGKRVDADSFTHSSVRSKSDTTQGTLSFVEFFMHSRLPKYMALKRQGVMAVLQPESWLIVPLFDRDREGPQVELEIEPK
jgi:hypothetical protein